MKKSLVEFVNSEIVPKYGIVVYPVVLSAEEYKSRLSEDAFIIDVHARGEVLYAKSREDLVKWSLQEAEQYLQSAQMNVNADRRGRLERETHDKYLELATELHRAGYQPSKTFSKDDLMKNLRFAEDLLVKAKSIVMS